MNVFFVKHKTAYEMRISDWSSDVCSSDLNVHIAIANRQAANIDGRRCANGLGIVLGLQPVEQVIRLAGRARPQITDRFVDLDFEQRPPTTKTRPRIETHCQTPESRQLTTVRQHGGTCLRDAVGDKD